MSIVEYEVHKYLDAHMYLKGNGEEPGSLYLGVTINNLGGGMVLISTEAFLLRPSYFFLAAFLFGVAPVFVFSFCTTQLPGMMNGRSLIQLLPRYSGAETRVFLVLP